MSAISPNQITVGRFRFNLSPQQALDLLTATYRLEVEKRHRKFILDDNTTDNLIRFTSYITQPVPEFGVMLCGTCGNGKTTLLYAFRRAINVLNGLGHFTFLTSVDPNFHPGLTTYRAREIVQLSSNTDRFEKIKNSPMLAIDDLGTEPLEKRDYGDIITPVVELIEHRYNKQLFTFITTNLIANSKDDDTVTIRSKYGDRVADRFNEMLHVIVFKDTSYRTKPSSTTHKLKTCGLAKAQVD